MNRKPILVVALLVIAAVLAFVPAWTATLTSSMQLTVKSTHTSAVGLSTVDDTLGYSINKSWTNGTDSAQCDLVYHGSASISNGATATLDLAGGLTDAFGTTITFVKVKTVLVENTSASMTLVLGAAASNPWQAWTNTTGSTINIPPGGVVVLSAPLAGWAVGAGSADVLAITNPGASATIYKIWIVGTSA